MLTKPEVDSLLSLPKTTENRHVDLKYHKTVLYLTAKQESKLKFRLHINTSKKIRFKLHCHHDHDTIGLLRIDFFGGHRNPAEITDDVPKEIRKYVGMRFSRNDHHVHVYVENQDLKWAIPIDDSFLKTTDIKSSSDVISVVREVASYINLETNIMFSMSTY